MIQKYYLFLIIMQVLATAFLQPAKAEGRTPEYIAALQVAIETYPDNVAARNNCALALVAAEDYDAAIALLKGHVESDGSLQLSFFQLEDPLLMSLRDELNSADLDNMTPMQAFDLLRNMKSQMKG